MPSQYIFELVNQTEQNEHITNLMKQENLWLFPEMIIKIFRVMNLKI